MDEVGRECVEALVGSVPPAEALAALTALLAFARNLLTEPGNPKFVWGGMSVQLDTQRRMEKRRRGRKA